MFSKVSSEHIKEFAAIIGEEFTFTDKEILEQNSKDYTEDLRFYPEVVLRPGNAMEISQILKICNRDSIPVTPRGAGTGLSGGALPEIGRAHV